MSIQKVQELVVQVNSKKLLRIYLETVLPTALSSDEEIALLIISPDTDDISNLPPPLSDRKDILPIMLICGQKERKKTDPQNHYEYGDNEFSGKKWELCQGMFVRSQALKRIESILKTYEKRWKKLFLEQCGDGYNSFFNEMAGTIEIGYEIRNCHCSPEILAISLCHIYYGN